MIVKIAKRGHSFKSLGDYLTKPKEGHHRALWTSAENLATDSPDLAAKIMAATDSQSGSRSKKGNVSHFILSWHGGDKPHQPTEAEQLEAARDFLKSIGLDKAQALIVAHDDNGFKHCHIMANMIDPERGRIWADPKNPDQTSRNFTSNLQRKASDWRKSYDIENYGYVLADGAHKGLSRPAFERMEKDAPASWMDKRATAALYKATFRAELEKAKGEKSAAHKAEWRALFKSQEGSKSATDQMISRARIEASAARADAKRTARALKKAELRSGTTLGRITQTIGITPSKEAAASDQQAAARNMVSAADRLAAAELGKAQTTQRHERQRRDLGNKQSAQIETLAGTRAKDKAASGAILLRALTDQKSTFTKSEFETFCKAADFDSGKLYASADLVKLDGDRFTSRELMDTEHLMIDRAIRMASSGAHGIAVQANADGLADEQRHALEQITGESALSSVIGYAGAGKSFLLSRAAEAWQNDGFKVEGAALSAIAAHDLGEGAGVKAGTLHSLLHRLERKNTLDTRTVLIVDEAGLIGSRQMADLLRHADEAGAKVVLTGDPQQLQAIDAGGAFKAIATRTGASELQTVRRQEEAWQAEATKQLAGGEAARAIGTYAANGGIIQHDDKGAAAAATVDAWANLEKNRPGTTQIMLAPTRKDVAALNDAARDIARDNGQLGDDREIITATGAQDFASGDRLLFTRNDKALDVKNGSLGTIESIEGEGRAARLMVKLDGQDEAIEVAASDYGSFTHGYALTIHKAQGVTVDHSHIMAGRFMDNHSAYVAMSRHRESMTMHYAADDFRDQAALERALSRQNLKDTTLDHEEQHDMALTKENSQGAFNSEARDKSKDPAQIETQGGSHTFDPPKLGIGSSPSAPTKQASEVAAKEAEAHRLDKATPKNETREVQPAEPKKADAGKTAFSGDSLKTDKAQQAGKPDQSKADQARAAKQAERLRRIEKKDQGRGGKGDYGISD